MLPTHSLDALLRNIPESLREIVFELRNIIRSVAPNVTETCHSKGFSYYYRERGGPVSAGLCQIGIFKDHVRLAFVHGAFLPDPEHLLQGAPQYKRYIRLDSFEQAPWDYLKDLIVSSSRFDPRSLTF